MLSHVIEALGILAKYYDGNDGYNLAGEHEQLYAYQTNRPMDPADVARMRELGWFQPGEASYDPVYNPEEKWSIFL